MIIDAKNIKPLETFTALQVLEAVGYDLGSPKVKRAAEYLELWREKSLEAKNSATIKVGYFENGQKCQDNTLYLERQKTIHVELARMPGHFMEVGLL